MTVMDLDVRKPLISRFEKSLVQGLKTEASLSCGDRPGCKSGAEQHEVELGGRVVRVTFVLVEPPTSADMRTVYLAADLPDRVLLCAAWLDDGERRCMEALDWAAARGLPDRPPREPGMPSALASCTAVATSEPHLLALECGGTSGLVLYRPVDSPVRPFMRLRFGLSLDALGGRTQTSIAGRRMFEARTPPERPLLMMDTLSDRIVLCWAPARHDEDRCRDIVGFLAVRDPITGLLVRDDAARPDLAGRALPVPRECKFIPLAFGGGEIECPGKSAFLWLSAFSVMGVGDTERDGLEHFLSALGGWLEGPVTVEAAECTLEGEQAECRRLTGSQEGKLVSWVATASVRGRRVFAACTFDAAAPRSQDVCVDTFRLGRLQSPRTEAR